MFMMKEAFKYVHDEVDDAVFHPSYKWRGTLVRIHEKVLSFFLVRHAGRQNAGENGCELACIFRTYYVSCIPENASIKFLPYPDAVLVSSTHNTMHEVPTM